MTGPYLALWHNFCQFFVRVRVNIYEYEAAAEAEAAECLTWLTWIG
jgi:hypothetical protein